MQISLDVCCDVELVSSNSLGWESNAPDAFTVSETSHHLSIRQKNRGGNTVTIGNVVMTGGSRQVVVGANNTTFIGDGGIWVNGRRVDVPGDDSPIPEAPRLTVNVPPGTDLTVKTSGSSDIRGDALIGSLSLSTSGSTDVDLSVHSADLRTSGSSDISLKLLGGRINSSFSGSTRFSVS